MRASSFPFEESDRPWECCTVECRPDWHCLQVLQSFLNPISRPDSDFSPSSTAPSQELPHPSSPAPTLAGSHFAHGDLSVCSLPLSPHWLQSISVEGETTSEHCLLTTTCWRMGFFPSTQCGAVRRHFRSLLEHRAPRQSLLSTNWSKPLGFVYLNGTLRPWGVCWGKSKMPYIFFPLLHPLSSLFSSFCSYPLQLCEPEILGKHPISVALYQ